MGEYLFGQIDDQIRRMSTGLAAGFGGTRQEACGLLSGGTLLIGDLLGRVQPDEDDAPCLAAVSRYRERFIQEFGATRCQDLRDMGYGSENKSCIILYKWAIQAFLEELGGDPSR